jgi:hypothetical protein
MKCKTILITAITGVALALPAVSSAAPTPPLTGQDSVSLTDGPATFGAGFTIEELSATSGPSGENPTGEVRFGASSFSDFGPVTCLTASGNSATLNYESQFILTGQIVTVRVVDDNPDTISILVLGRAATDCSPPPAINVNPLTSGDITVVDAQPLPIAIRQCKKSGWKQFGFRSQGQCVRFVKQGPRG